MPAKSEISFSIDFIRHRDISSALLNEIIALKQQHWPYTTDSHREWIDKNISGDDVHLVISNKTLLAYLNIIQVSANIMQSPNIDFSGIGNVCVNTQVLGQHYALLLIKAAEWFNDRKMDNCVGVGNDKKNMILLCSNKLIPFYEKICWHKYRGELYIENELSCLSLYSRDILLQNEIIFNRKF
jgi:predicted GNAT family N-acyltransferase